MAVAIMLLMLLLRGAEAGAPIGGDDMLRISANDVVVVAVQSVDDRVSTNAHPPVLRLRIDEVLRGKLKSRQVIDATWDADGQGGFYAMRDGGEDGLRRWQESRLTGPPEGSRWIVMLQPTSRSAYGILIRPRYPFSAEVRNHVIALIKQGPKPPSPRPARP